MLTITRVRDDATLTEKLRISGASPREQMTAELMEQIERGTPNATLTGQSLAVLGCERFPRLSGDILTVRDDFGHRYIYRVTGYDWAADTFDLEWPD